jgi:hypothetical protein
LGPLGRSRHVGHDTGLAGIERAGRAGGCHVRRQGPGARSHGITLFPGESQTLTVTWNSADLQGATAVVSLSGWNVPKIDILA